MHVMQNVVQSAPLTKTTIPDLGKKIAVIGVSASGKSTFARKLAAKTHMPLTHMDSLMWQPDWQYIGDEATWLKLKEVISGESWIIEGFLDKDWLREVFQNADTIIYLNHSRTTLLWRYLKRSWQHRKNARPEIPGCPDTFSLSFLVRILKRKETYWPDKELSKGSYESKLIKLHSPKEANKFLALI